MDTIQYISIDRLRTRAAVPSRTGTSLGVLFCVILLRQECVCFHMLSHACLCYAKLVPKTESQRFSSPAARREAAHLGRGGPMGAGEFDATRPGNSTCNRFSVAAASQGAVPVRQAVRFRLTVFSAEVAKMLA